MILRANVSSVAVARKGPGRPREFDRDAGLRTALDMFRKRGYEAVSIAELREALGITQASLYAAYGSKQALFEEAVALYQATEGGSTARALAGGATAQEAIAEMLRQAVRTFATQRQDEAGCLIVLGAVNCSLDNKGIGEHLKQLRLHHFKMLEDRLLRGIRERELPATTPVKAIAGFYATTLHGLSVQARDGFSAKALQAVVDCSLSAWDQLIQAS